MIQSIARAFDVLKTVSAFPEGLSSGAIAEMTGLHPSTASRIVSTLEQLGALKRESGLLVSIGDGIFELVNSTPWTQQMIHIAQPIMQDLADETGEVVGLASVRDGLCEIFFQIESDHHVKIRDWTGLSFPLHVTSTGKIYLVNTSKEKQGDFLKSPLPKLASASVSQSAALREELQALKGQAYAWTIDELEDGLSSIAAAITDGRGSFKAGLYLSAPSYRLEETGIKQRLEYLIPAAAREISERLAKNHAASLKAKTPA